MVDSEHLSFISDSRCTPCDKGGNKRKKLNHFSSLRQYQSVGGCGRVQVLKSLSGCLSLAA